MKKILFLFALLFMGAMTAFAQVPVNEQLTYQTVVRNAQNQLVFSQDNVSVTVEVCNADGSVVRYSETHTGLSTNANGLLTLMVGGGTLVSGAWTDIDWSDAAIRTTVSYDPGTGTVSIPSGLAPISAVPYALQAGNGTVPNAITSDLATTLASACTQEAVNLCDLFVVFDSLNRRINSVYDSLQRLNDELTAVKSTIPPVTSAPTVSNVTSASMNVKANATSDGFTITSYEFCISTNSNMSGATCQTVQASDADNYIFTGLIPNTNYYVQYSATNFAGTTTSASVLQRTPAHAPTATVSDPTAAKPAAGFKVEVTGIDPKEKNDATTVQVCYKQSASCSVQENYDDYTCADAQSVASGITTNTQTITGLAENTAYCVIVKVSNGDSTTIYGPTPVTTGANVTMTISGPSDTNRCGSETINVPFTATITGDDASDFTYTWSAGTSTTHLDTVSLGATSTITVTATHSTEGYTLTASHTVTVGNNPVNIGFCEYEGVVSVVVGPQGSPNSISWGDGQSGTSVSDTTTHDYTALGTGSHSVTITASNSDGCIFSRTMTVNVFGSGSTAADRTVKPCSVGSHAAQTGPSYMGNGFGGANHGLETVNGSGQITSVTDCDGNEYPVVEIGSQCWTAVNLRTTHYANGNSITQATPPTRSYTDPYRYDYSSSNIPLEQRGYFYNWAAAMQGVCPVGWHVPTDAEWSTMVAAAEATETGASGTGNAKLTTGCNWLSDGSSQDETTTKPSNYSYTKRNESGFSVVPAGQFNGSSLDYEGKYIDFWSTSQSGPNYAYIRGFDFNKAGVARTTHKKENGYSVRCVRD